MSLLCIWSADNGDASGNNRRSVQCRLLASAFFRGLSLVSSLLCDVLQDVSCPSVFFRVLSLIAPFLRDFETRITKRPMNEMA